MNKAKPTLKNIIAYITGNLRYKIWYNPFLRSLLIRKHIEEQIQARIESMDIECYYKGQCKMCGCQTTALQMANKACDKPCYPEMLSKKEWTILKDRKILYKNRYYWQYRNGKFKKFEQ